MPVRQWLSTAIYSGGRIAKQIDQLADTPKVVARGYIQKALNGLVVADLLGRMVGVPISEQTLRNKSNNAPSTCHSTNKEMATHTDRHLYR